MPWYSYALISAAGIALVGLLEKKTLQREHSSEYVAVFSIMKLALFLLFFSSSVIWTVSSSNFIWLVIDGAIGALAFFMVAKAIRRMEISSAVPILALDPGLTAILAFFFLGERLNGTHIVGLFFLVIGTYILELHRSHDQLGHPLTNIRTMISPLTNVWRQTGGGYILAGLVLFSVASTLDRFVLTRVPTTTYVGYTLIVNTVIFLILLVRSRNPLQLLRPGRGYLLFFITIAAAAHLISNLSQAKAVSIAAVGLVIGVKRLSVLIDVILGGKYFHERHLPQKIVATLIMLVGLFFVVRP